MGRCVVQPALRETNDLGDDVVALASAKTPFPSRLLRPVSARYSRRLNDTLTQCVKRRRFEYFVGENTPREDVDHLVAMPRMMSQHDKSQRVIPKNVDQVLNNVLAALTQAFVIGQRTHS